MAIPACAGLDSDTAFFGCVECGWLASSMGSGESQERWEERLRREDGRGKGRQGQSEGLGHRTPKGAPGCYEHAGVRTGNCAALELRRSQGHTTFSAFLRAPWTGALSRDSGPLHPWEPGFVALLRKYFCPDPALRGRLLPWMPTTLLCVTLCSLLK